MLSSGEDKPDSEALLSQPGLGWLQLVWATCGFIWAKARIIHSGSEESSSQSSCGIQYRSKQRERNRLKDVNSNREI